ncbi:helix-turn-helix domain-containing protein [Hyphomicrobium sp. MC8b]|uniref:helix-turn-helix domain-containing protein n=1 Tax=Hyphomicrobium sp. MC8b TaxID=300273 RepID=UPI00391A5518
MQTLESEPLVALHVLKHLAVKIRELTQRAYEFSSLDVASRTRAELLRLARFSPRLGKRVSIAPVPTHAEIASRISTHREAVTREISRLSKLGIVQCEGSALVGNRFDYVAGHLLPGCVWHHR